ncbi:MAG: phosphatase PAP2 family protein [Candidatus Kapaibacterium sp.]
MIRLYSILIIFFLSVNVDSLSGSIFSKIGEDFSACGNDYARFFGRGEAFTIENGIILAGLPAAGFAADKPLQEYFEKQSGNEYKLFYYLGDTRLAAALSLGTYASGLAFDDGLRETGRQLINSIIFAGVLNGVVKYSFGRARPPYADGVLDFNFFESGDSYQSFPSGHTVTAFTLASVLSRRIDKSWATAGLFTAASLTGIHRMDQNRHWFSDVLAGAAIGYFASKLGSGSSDAYFSMASGYPKIVFCLFKY